MQKMKSCPFCGGQPEQRNDDYDFVGCSNIDCDLNGVEIQEDYWNTRTTWVSLGDGAEAMDLELKLTGYMAMNRPRWKVIAKACARAWGLEYVD